MIVRKVRKYAIPLLLFGYSCVAWLIYMVPGRWDVTVDRRFSLPDALKEDIKLLPRRVQIRLFTTFAHPDFGIDFVRYQQRLLEVLGQLTAESRGKLNFEVLDPNGDPRASRIAAVDEVRMIANGNADPFCFGLVVECLDKKRTFEFLDPRRSQYFLNDLIQAIFQVGRDRLPSIGIWAPFFGGQKSSEDYLSDWTGIGILRHGYELSFLDAKMEWKDLNMVILLQPFDSDEALDAKCEALLRRGCDVLVLADPLSVGIESMGDRRVAKMRSAGLPRFVEARGVHMNSHRVIYDFQLQTPVSTPQGRRANPAILTLGANKLNTEHPITAGVDQAQFYLAGALELSPPKQYKVEILASSSDQATLADADIKLLTDPSRDETMLAGIQRMKAGFPLLAMLQNTNDPKEGRLLVGSDIDWLHREVAGALRADGSLQTQNANAALMQNLMDYLAGDRALRETRLRGLAQRPLSHWSEIRNSQMEPYREPIGAMAKEIETLESEVTGLEATRNISGANASENEHASRRLRQLREEVRIRRAELARVRNERNARIKSIMDLINWSNVLLPPMLLMGMGWMVVGWRRRRSQRVFS